MQPNSHSREGMPRSRAARRTKRCWTCRLLAGVLLFTALAALGAAYVTETLGVPPRLLAPYIEKRTSGHNPTIVHTGEMVGRILRTNDRGTAVPVSARAFRIGAQAEPPGKIPVASEQSVIVVTSTAEALAAIARASPGDSITFAPGTYRFTGGYVAVNRPGTALRPITVRAEQPGTVTLGFGMSEGFLVSAPYWHFENLTIIGACDSHRACEHAFHVVGSADHFVARNNTITDFNSHFKINASGDKTPDDGVLEGNTLNNTSVRQTDSPVDVIDLVVASNWIIRKNLITDFFKGEGNRTSYGGFAKGGGSNNLFENNIVLCEYRVHSPGAITVGLSLGGGGTGAQYCRDKRCVTEQDRSTIRGNLIAACSDEGIYINKGAMSKVIHNTLIDTAGISVRFPSSSADVEGNLIDGKIRRRDDATLRTTDNIETSLSRLFVGSHPVRDLFDIVDSASFQKVLPRRSVGPAGPSVPDLCGAPPGGSHAYGAFDRFADCVR